MSHSTVLVIGPTTEKELAVALAPFDENLEVKPYIDATKADQLKKRRQRLQEAAENRARYNSKVAPYDSGSLRPSEAHLEWILTKAPAEALLTDEALWEVILESETWTERDADGNSWSTYNPRSRWDWYEVGGSWTGGLVLRDTSETNFVSSLEQLDLNKTHSTFAVLTPDGEWHERGKMLWFGITVDEQEQTSWDSEWRSYVRANLNKPAFLVDVHI